MNYQFNPYYQEFQQRSAINNAFNPIQQPVQPVCVNVSSVDEVRSYRIDPMNTYVFLDTPNNKIYTKRIGSTGAAEIQAYALDNPPTPISSEEKIALLEKKIEALMKGANNE